MSSTSDVPNPTPSHARMVQLDVLRGVAILLVLCRHAPVPWAWAGPLMPAAHFLWKLGWSGVDLFFVLSGFLIGGLLFKEIKKTDRLDVKRFLIRRGMKIWPAYFVFLAYVYLAQYTAYTPGRLLAPEVVTRFPHHPILALASIWYAHGHSAWKSLQDIWPNLIHAQNYFNRSIRGVTWSLAVEEHFYLVLPLVLLLLVRRRKPGSTMPMVPIIAVALIVVCTALRFITNWNRPFADVTHVFPTHLRIDGLFFGVLIAYLFHLQPKTLARIARYPELLLVIGLALVLPMGYFEISQYRFDWTIGFTMLYVGYGCILIACVYSPPGRPLGNLLASRPAAVVAWIGVFSYSIYLWHFDLARDPIYAWISPDRPPHHHLSMWWALVTVLFVTMSVLGGAALSRLIEFPTLKIRDRLFPARADAIDVKPAPAAPQQPTSAFTPAAPELAGQP
jgi:peptidoglycan/LPS O-acetylase OafA/YrhL